MTTDLASARALADRIRDRERPLLYGGRSGKTLFLQGQTMLTQAEHTIRALCLENAELREQEARWQAGQDVIAAADNWRAADIFLLKCGQDGGVDEVFDGMPASAGEMYDAAFQALRDAVDAYHAATHAPPAQGEGDDG